MIAGKNQSTSDSVSSAGFDRSKHLKSRSTRITEDSSLGRNFLFVTGILYIVFAGIGILGNLSTSITITQLTPWAAELVSRHLAISFFVNALALTVGIMGIVFSKRNDKAKMLAICVVIYYVLVMLINFAILQALPPLWLIVIELILPILFLVGAYKNHQEAR